VRAVLDQAPIMPATILVDALQRCLADDSLHACGLYLARAHARDGGAIQMAVVPDELHRVDAHGFISPRDIKSKEKENSHDSTSSTSSIPPKTEWSYVSSPTWARWALSKCTSAHPMETVEVHTLTSDYPRATRIVAQPLPSANSLPPHHVLVVRTYAGVNASDVNHSAGRYHASTAAAEAALPFPSGFESVGIVAAVGSGVDPRLLGSAVACLTYGGFATHAVVKARECLPIPGPEAEGVALMTSGLTASLALHEVGEIKPGEVVLVTAAAGGTGQFAVQIAKQCGCVVVATCGGSAKKSHLLSLGVDRVIDYHAEPDVGKVLRAEYPQGVDVVYESVGGKMFETCVKALGVGGRLIVIGMMSQYADGWVPQPLVGVPERLLAKSASVRGFFLLHYTRKFREHLRRLGEAYVKGDLRVTIDSASFVGLRDVTAAVQHLQSGKSAGKVVIKMWDEVPGDLDRRARL
jgi:NADPH:quinone reductase-like Zn-dependent oxidoreductase